MNLKPTKQNRDSSEKKEDNIIPMINEDGYSDPIKMLGGYIDSEGMEHNTFVIREMNGKDEEATSTADVKSNGSKLITTLLERCVISIGTLTRKELGSDKWRNVIKSLYVGDQDYIFMKIRELTYGDIVTVAHKCPQCGASLKTEISTSEFNIIPFEKAIIPFDLPKGVRDKKGVLQKTGHLRLNTGSDREILTPLATKNLGKATTLMLTRVCQFDDESFRVDEDVMGYMTSKDREYLANLLHEAQFGYDLKTEASCTECGNVFEVELNAINFL